MIAQGFGILANSRFQMLILRIIPISSRSFPNSISGSVIGDGWANKRSVWFCNTKGTKHAHFATFPEELIVDMVKAGCPKGGVVLDPFMGAGTTGLVARKLGRNYIGFELNPEYIKIAEKRIDSRGIDFWD